MRFLKRVGERGTVTLPMEIREALGVTEGDIVEFDVVGVVKRHDGTTQEIRLGGAAANPALVPTAAVSEPRAQPQ